MRPGETGEIKCAERRRGERRFLSERAATSEKKRTKSGEP